MNSSDINGSCLFDGKSEIYTEFDCHLSNHDSEGQNVTKQSALDVVQSESMRRLNKNDASVDEKMALLKTSSFVVSPETYKALMDSLYTSRLWFLRARNITMNQLNVYKEEAIEHMHEIKSIIHEEMENPEASVGSLAQELVKTGTEVIRNQQALNRIEMEELLKNLDGLLDTLSSDIKEVKNLAEPDSDEESKNRSYVDLIFDYGHWCLFVLCAPIVLIIGLSRYVPAFQKY
ncbi:uncharacterized protein LOC129966774 [Argiope bruennichi]|uniref:uncharacterized protein LOC129966774 n=1 Tax=Argiope bruennichi TaxID=94029 RepID=UPI00249495FE|nr:uncharacterized protein LOC129966774 [Argiope bruennichi]